MSTWDLGSCDRKSFINNQYKLIRTNLYKMTFTSTWCFTSSVSSYTVALLISRAEFVSPRLRELKKMSTISGCSCLFVTVSSILRDSVCCSTCLPAYLEASLLSMRHAQSDKISASSDKAERQRTPSLFPVRSVSPSNFSPQQQISF